MNTAFFYDHFAYAILAIYRLNLFRITTRKGESTILELPRRRPNDMTSKIPEMADRVSAARRGLGNLPSFRRRPRKVPHLLPGLRPANRLGQFLGQFSQQFPASWVSASWPCRPSVWASAEIDLRCRPTAPGCSPAPSAQSMPIARRLAPSIRPADCPGRFSTRVSQPG